MSNPKLPSAHAGGYGHVWAIILAAGEGSRLKSLTATPRGDPVPKQFCSFMSGQSLLRQTIIRAERIVPKERIVVIVAKAHKRYWRGRFSDLPAPNIIIQPENRGTGPGILLPLLHILRQDPGARVIVLPSDHYLEDERVLQISFRAALQAAQDEENRAILLGITPDGADPQYGWIVPGASAGRRVRQIASFVEKPPSDLAQALFSRGALWSSFLFAARVSALLRLYESAAPLLLRTFLANLEALGVPEDGRKAEWVIEDLYHLLPTLDFSRDVLAHTAGLLWVMNVPPCGWSDLGTPERVVKVLSRRGHKARFRESRLGISPPDLSAAAHLAPHL